jgi:hypothetical protein
MYFTVCAYRLGLLIFCSVSRRSDTRLLPVATAGEGTSPIAVMNVN